MTKSNVPCWMVLSRWTKPMLAEGQHGRQWMGRRDHKECVIGIRQRGGALRFFHAEDAKSGTLAKYIQENISQDVDVIVTDELRAYPARPWAMLRHSTRQSTIAPESTSGSEPTFTRTASNRLSRCSSGASSERGTNQRQASASPTWTK